MSPVPFQEIEESSSLFNSRIKELKVITGAVLSNFKLSPVNWSKFSNSGVPLSIVKFDSIL